MIPSHGRYHGACRKSSPPDHFFLSLSRNVVKTRKFFKISLIFPLCRNPISNPFETWCCLLTTATFPFRTLFRFHLAPKKKTTRSLIFNYLSAPPQLWLRPFTIFVSFYHVKWKLFCLIFLFFLPFPCLEDNWASDWLYMSMEVDKSLILWKIKAVFFRWTLLC